MKQNFSLILASSSPRRKQLLSELGYEFISESPDIDETPDARWPIHTIAEELALKKCAHIAARHSSETAVLAADCTVIYNQTLLEKPADREEAISFLTRLSGQVHEVVSGYALSYRDQVRSGSSTTRVYFNDLTEEEILYYVDNYETLDKAGAYGIQDWIGLTAVKKLEGSYTNIVGLPTADVYQLLKTITFDS